MNIRDKMVTMLTNNGMFTGQAEQVLTSIIGSKLEKEMDMTNRWNSNADDYPPAMINYLGRIIKKEAANWLKENYPEAWCIPMLEA